MKEFIEISTTEKIVAIEIEDIVGLGCYNIESGMSALRVYCNTAEFEFLYPAEKAREIYQSIKEKRWITADPE